MSFLKKIFNKNKEGKTNAEQKIVDKPSNSYYVPTLDKSQSENLSLNLKKEESLKQLNLRKEMILSLCLEKKELTDLTARVAIVLDFSYSMDKLYRVGKVQKLIDRLLPLAMQFDDNKEMEIWLFSDGYYRLKDISLNNYYEYIKNERLLSKYKMGGTAYAPVISDVVKKYTREEPSNLPTLTLFITDGDNFSSDKFHTTQEIVNASKHPIFWQFVGIGNSSFDYLEQLDEMTGRYIDNANFFSANDLESISDEELYNRLLAEYPVWIKEAKDKKILK